MKNDGKNTSCFTQSKQALGMLLGQLQLFVKVEVGSKGCNLKLLSGQISAQYMKKFNKPIWMTKENSSRGMIPPLKVEEGKLTVHQGML